MKNKIIAYLIQAHNNEKHLYEMISSLNNKEVSFFVSMGCGNERPGNGCFY